MRCSWPGAHGDQGTPPPLDRGHRISQALRVAVQQQSGQQAGGLHACEEGGRPPAPRGLRTGQVPEKPVGSRPPEKARSCLLRSEPLDGPAYFHHIPPHKRRVPSEEDLTDLSW